jgi:6-phosphogluconolactonase (cycloisomerase 2 family)
MVALGGIVTARSPAVDRSGQFVYVTNTSSDDVSAFTIDGASGALTPVAGAPFAAGN